MFRTSIIFYLCLLFSLNLDAQNQSYWETEFMLGKAVPHYPDFPKNSINTAGQITWGHWNTQTQTGWQSFFNYPQYGLQFGWNALGNDPVLGHQYSVIPFITFSTRRNWQKGIQIRLALGASYSTRHYHPILNPNNKLLGSPYSWKAHGSLYKSWVLSQNIQLKTGIGFVHYSNGHTTIPNYGVNGIQALLALQYFPNKVPINIAPKHLLSNSPRPWYLIMRQNWGIHELGGAIYPIGGDKFSIYTTSIAIAIDWRTFLRFKAGLSYRFYNSYYHYIQEHQLAAYNSHARWSASAITLFGGLEMLLGHIGVEMELGINLYKPFYKTHFEVFEKTNTYDKITKRFIATRLGAKAYYFNHKHLPKHNFFIGAFINANMGQADFSDFTVGYVLRIH